MCGDGGGGGMRERRGAWIGCAGSVRRCRWIGPRWTTRRRSRPGPIPSQRQPWRGAHIGKEGREREKPRADGWRLVVGAQGGGGWATKQTDGCQELSSHTPARPVRRRPVPALLDRLIVGCLPLVLSVYGSCVGDVGGVPFILIAPSRGMAKEPSATPYTPSSQIDRSTSNQQPAKRTGRKKRTRPARVACQGGTVRRAAVRAAMAAHKTRVGRSCWKSRMQMGLLRIQ